VIGDRRRRARRTAAELERLPGICLALARELRAGRSLHLGLRAVAADAGLTTSGLAEVVRRSDAGEPVAVALAGWVDRLDHPDARLVRAVLVIGDATGVALAGSLDRAAASMRERADLRAEVRALTAQSRASAALLTVAPFGFLALMASVDRTVLTAGLTSPLGGAALVVGGGLDGLGWWWMRRQLAGVER
jgi:tight adherence protein B